MELGFTMEWGLVFSLSLMLDIARYSNQSAISLGCAAIGLNILPGIAGAASHIVSMTGGLGTPTIQYMRNRISRRFGNTAKKKEHSRPVWRRLSTFKCALSAASSCGSSPRPSLPWNSCDSFSRVMTSGCWPRYR